VTFSNGILMRDWYKRIAYISLILHNGNYFFFDINYRNWTESFSNSFKYINEVEFMELFYPQ